MNNFINSNNNTNLFSQLEEEKKEKKRLEELETFNNLLIDIYDKQNKYLQNLNYQKIIPLSVVSPNIDLLKIESTKILSMPNFYNEIDNIKYKLNQYFFEGTNNISIYNINAINSRIRYLNKNPHLNIIPGFKYFINNNELYAFRETYSKYIIDEKDLIQVLYQFDCFDIYNKQVTENLCLTSNYLSNFKIPINRPSSSSSNTQTILNTNDFKNNIKLKEYNKIADKLSNTSKINRFLIEIPLITNNLYKMDVNINILDIGKIIPSIIKYKDSNILGFNKTEKNKITNYLITKKGEDKILDKDFFNHIFFNYLFNFQRVIKNSNNYDVDIYNLLSYNGDDLEDNNMLINIISKYNYYKIYFNDFYFKHYYMNNYITNKVGNLYNKLILDIQENKNLKFNLKNLPSKRSIENLQSTTEKTEEINKIIEKISYKYNCTDNMPNYGYIIQLNTGNQIYNQTAGDKEIKVKLFEGINDLKFLKKNIVINETFQSENPTYACIYVDNNSHKTYYYAPTIAKPKEFISLRLRMMKFDLSILDFEDKYCIENDIAHLQFDNSIESSSYTDYLENYSLLSSSINDIKPEKTNGILDDILSNPNFRLSDLSGLYCLYFLTVMSSNMPDYNNNPISAEDNPFETYFNKIFRSIDDDIFKVENNKQKQKNAYLKHVQNVSDMIGDLLFIQNSNTFAKYDNKVEKYKDEKKELNEKILKKVLTFT
jgi:hypothetical protein